MPQGHARFFSFLLPITLLLLALPVAPWPLGASSARACSCSTPTREQAFESAAAVFEGRVTEVTRSKEGPDGGAPELMVTLQVVRAWKGVDGERMTVLTAGDEAACGYSFQQGESYLVYAHQAKPRPRVSLCGRTRPAVEAGEDIDAMGVGEVPVRPAPTKAEKQVYCPDARPEPRPAGCASCAVSASRSSLSGWAAGLLAAVWLAARRRRRSR